MFVWNEKEIFNMLCCVFLYICKTVIEIYSKSLNNFYLLTINTMKTNYKAPELEELRTLSSGVLCTSTGEAFAGQTTQDDEFYTHWE